jgi:hypothetical protein
VIQNQKYIFISQKKYIGELLNNFGMDECNHVSNPVEHNLKLTSKEGMNFRMKPSIDSLWEVLSILLPPDQTFHLFLGFFICSCKILVKDIDLLQKEY